MPTANWFDNIRSVGGGALFIWHTAILYTDKLYLGNRWLKLSKFYIFRILQNFGMFTVPVLFYVWESVVLLIASFMSILPAHYQAYYPAYYRAYYREYYRAYYRVYYREYYRAY